MRFGVHDPHEINVIAQLQHDISYMDITIESNLLQPLLAPFDAHNAKMYVLENKIK
jgi:hypothetical protein